MGEREPERSLFFFLESVPQELEACEERAGEVFELRCVRLNGIEHEAGGSRFVVG